MNRNRFFAAAAILFVIFLLNSAYIGAFASPSVFYMGNVLAHLVVLPERVPLAPPVAHDQAGGNVLTA